jgi:hypothetical protein
VVYQERTGNATDDASGEVSLASWYVLSVQKLLAVGTPSNGHHPMLRTSADSPPCWLGDLIFGTNTPAGRCAGRLKQWQRCRCREGLLFLPVFEKLGIGSRRELVAALSARSR